VNQEEEQLMARLRSVRGRIAELQCEEGEIVQSVQRFMMMNRPTSTFDKRAICNETERKVNDDA
jgi:hypothetical protein